MKLTKKTSQTGGVHINPNGISSVTSAYSHIKYITLAPAASPPPRKQSLLQINEATQILGRRVVELDLWR